LTKGVSEYIAAIKTECPRLFYLSTSEIFQIIAGNNQDIAGNANKLAAKLFDGISSLVLSE